MNWYWRLATSLSIGLGIAHAQSVTSFESASDFVKPTLEVTLATATQSSQGVTDGNSALLAAMNVAPTGYPGFS